LLIVNYLFTGNESSVVRSLALQGLLLRPQGQTLIYEVWHSKSSDNLL
jgi:hypothetical protein